MYSDKHIGMFSLIRVFLESKIKLKRQVLKYKKDAVAARGGAAGRRGFKCAVLRMCGCKFHEGWDACRYVQLC